MWNTNIYSNIIVYQKYLVTSIKEGCATPSLYHVSMETVTVANHGIYKYFEVRPGGRVERVSLVCMQHPVTKVPLKQVRYARYWNCFYTPVFRRDVLWYGDVRPSRSPSVRPSQFSSPFSYMLWDIKLKFCVSLYFDARKIKFECHQFPSVFAGVMPLLNFTLLQICSFPHISHTCFDILSWNFAYDFVLLYFRSNSSVINLRQFLLELRPFWNLEYWKYSFLHFSLRNFDILSWNFSYDFV